MRVHAVGMEVSPDGLTIDIDQWNKVCQVLGTPPRDFFKQLQPSVSLVRALYALEFMRGVFLCIPIPYNG